MSFFIVSAYFLIEWSRCGDVRHTGHCLRWYEPMLGPTNLKTSVKVLILFLTSLRHVSAVGYFLVKMSRKRPNSKGPYVGL